MVDIVRLVGKVMHVTLTLFLSAVCCTVVIVRTVFRPVG